ncbi:hypothetical protein [Flavobacterium sp. SM2513]|uniref:hypothetical protein n=1 Tax=Flavobacterium sp. SM2513 TaxID=3424766 RepID=UPI003D7F463B
MKTKYTDKIVALLDEEISFETFENWYTMLDFLEQPDILRELKAIIEERYDVNKTTFAASKIFENEINAFEDLILTHKLSKEMRAIEKENTKTQKQKLMEDLVRLRIQTIFLFTNKKAPIALLIETAKKLIATEKLCGIHDPENWKVFDELL